MKSGPLYGGIEAGGTKFLCIVGRGPSEIFAETRIETRTPRATLEKVIEFFRPYCSPSQVQTIGLGCFGPLDLDPSSPTYGCITSTPKPGWQNTNVIGPLKAALPVKVVLDTDVNVAALGEHTWGAAAGVNPSLYVTVGTGIGSAFLLDGKPLRGLLHPEMGHIYVQHDLSRDPFPGSCPFHGDCLEGLASGPAIEKRFGRRGEKLTDADPFWDLEAAYIASALATYILILSPRRIILGGGILRREFLFSRIRQQVLRLLGSYVQADLILGHIEEYIVPPGLNTDSGVFGALALASRSASVSKGRQY